MAEEIMYAYIAITGNIASGKTTLARDLENRWKYEFFKEEVDPRILDPFYKDRKTYGKQTQVHFITTRSEDLEKILFFLRLAKNNGSPYYAVTDSVFGVDSQVYAKNLLQEENLTSEEYAETVEFENSHTRHIPDHDLLIYLRTSVSVLKQRIIARGRPNEQELALPENDYLDKLNVLHEESFTQYKGKKAVITTDNLALVPDFNRGNPKPTSIDDILNFILSCLKSEDDKGIFMFS
ncbi:MAG: deoxynucleoside kinase [Nanoarchaeota archaeon]